ncbi:CobW-like GTP-binding protein [Rhodopirellula sp. JC740]|uniref:CobW-like GTP-binding protein n=1 Tax=Rhodopirellula halodulae TaxID=2894198 RepID=A0ABS8NE08_9BACT|nr:CobW-like GTP-binding protein [Rhodopirellula sp. JC740]MCC9641794.1 CobW-like GTP-binding protein [Rhodopirellula sp. JC740]
MTQPIEFVMIGGFLGAGKTTLISRLAKRLQAEGKHVCVVTNDQAAGLVDTQLLKSQGLEVNEVAGSCFCCNFDGLTDAMEEFETRQRPDVILAEPVGSCTDLIATIAAPMMQRLGEKFVHRPYAVVLKPNHGKKILTRAGGGFSEKAEYIFRKQLEESEVILINRVDELSPEDLQLLTDELNRQYPGRKIIPLSAKTGENLDALFETYQCIASDRESMMEVDYDVYADGEAELGWLNATVQFTSREPFALDSLSVNIIEELRQRFLAAGAEPGHLKVLCNDESNGDTVSVANLIDSDSETVLSIPSEVNTTHATAIINARVRLAPESLAEDVQQTIDKIANGLGATTETTQLDSFRPGRPEPTYRVQ